jgi:hypothetical protein
MHNRKLLAKLSLCAWEVLSDYLKTSVAANANDEKVKPGAAIAIQTFGELLNFNSHLHIIASDGCFNENGDFLYGISPNAEDLTAPFAKAVLKMLKSENVISLTVINNMSTWQHSGFNVHCGSPVSCSDAEAVERLARYIVRAPISQERMKYLPNTSSTNSKGTVIYEGKTTGKLESFSALDFLARLVTHIPNKYEQTVRYYGFYSNKSRGVRAKALASAIEEAAVIDKTIEKTATIVESATIEETAKIIAPISLSRKRFKKNWARLIQKIYNVDPLKCPKCGGKMRIIAFIEEDAVIRKILTHLNLWLSHSYHDPPTSSDSFSNNIESASQYADSLSLIDNETLEDTQLNMFSENMISKNIFSNNTISERSYEWWEARNTNRMNSGVYSQLNDNPQFSDKEYQHPFEDEFSQEVFYED